MYSMLNYLYIKTTKSVVLMMYKTTKSVVLMMYKTSA